MERIIQADIIPEDDKIEQGLRPSHLSEYIGCLLYTSPSPRD